MMIINKTMDPEDLVSPKAKEIIAELGELYTVLKARGLKISSWGGSFDLTGDKRSSEVLNRGYNYRPVEGMVDDRNFPWFLYWEIVWIILNAEFRKGQKVLDLGGSSSLFSYYLASKGIDVTTIDLNRELVENANLVGQKMGWELSNSVMNMSEMKFESGFNHITSICVFEHLKVKDRIKTNESVARYLEPGGRLSITFDYRNPSRFVRINSPEDVYEQLARPTGLRVRGNQTFLDNGESYLLHPFYHPDVSLKYRIWHILHGHFRPWKLLKTRKENDYTFGALFQEKM